jgi:hypothetical protein
MRVKAILFAAVSSMVVAACSSEPQAEQTASARQGLTDGDPLGGLGRKFIDTGMSMYDWIYKISQIYEPTFSTQDFFDLRSRVGALESDVAELREAAKALARLFDALATEDRARDVALAFAGVKTALDIKADQPERAAAASDMALLSANMVDTDKDEFFVFLNSQGGRLFEPRLATPTFFTAVTTWLAIRESGNMPMSAATDERLRSFARRMEWIVDQTRDAVSCVAVQENDTVPCQGKPEVCERKVCNTYVECGDRIAGQTTRFDQSSSDGDCSSQYRVPAPDREAALEQGRYAADTNAATAAGWRAYADMPNRNLALSRPAFQWPDSGIASAQAAVDGNTDGNFWDGSVSHTDEATGAWWWVDLGSVQHIREIRLFNRTDCCASRLSHYQVHISSDSTDGWDGTWAPLVDDSGLEIGDGDGAPRVHPVDTFARWVAVTKTDAGYLSLAEVQVMAD